MDDKTQKWIDSKVEGLLERRSKVMEDVRQIDEAIRLLKEKGLEIAPVFAEIKRAGLI